MKIAVFVACISLWTVSALCSDYTNSDKGIHSAGLGLDGTGVKVGQQEPTRPGKLPLDCVLLC
jgi:hypothetical protein